MMNDTSEHFDVHQIWPSAAIVGAITVMGTSYTPCPAQIRSIFTITRVKMPYLYFTHR